MTEQNQDGAQRIFINEVQRHQARYRKLIQFTHSSTKAAGVMLLAAVVALKMCIRDRCCGTFIYDDYPAGGCGLNWSYTSGRFSGANAAKAALA